MLAAARKPGHWEIKRSRGFENPHPGLMLAAARKSGVGSVRRKSGSSQQ
jgi:hypothetical protein